MIQDSFSDHGFGTKRAICIKCNRTLTNTRSVELGMGPICAGRAKAEAGMGSASGDIYLSEPHIREKIVLKLIEGRVATNVPNAIGHPWGQRGYGWGYGGSGPTNLAMNIVEIALAHTDYDTSLKVDYGGKKVSAMAWFLGHGFKAQFLVHMDTEGGEIAWESVLNWIHERVNEEVNFEPDE